MRLANHTRPVIHFAVRAVARYVLAYKHYATGALLCIYIGVARSTADLLNTFQRGAVRGLVLACRCL